MSGHGHAVYVYGVVSAAEMHPVGLTGVGPERNRVRYVSSSRVAAIVSDVRRGPLGRGEDIATHWRVLGAAVDRSTVLPLRFGAIMERCGGP